MSYGLKNIKLTFTRDNEVMTIDIDVKEHTVTVFLNGNEEHKSVVLLDEKKALKIMKWWKDNAKNDGWWMTEERQTSSY